MKSFKRITALLVVLGFASLLGCASSRTNEGTKAYVSDSVVTTKVKAAIFDEPSLKTREIGVETYKGAVQLSGFVNSTDQIHKAGDVARSVDGVITVKNDLRLK